MQRASAGFLAAVCSAALLLAACGRAGTGAETVALQSAGSVQASQAVQGAADAARATDETAAANSSTHAEPADAVWESADEVPIRLNGSAIDADAPGVRVEGSTATITAAGSYNLSGTLADGQIVVDTNDKGIVRLILNGVDIRSSTNAPIHIADADKAMVVLADGTQNHLSDASNYIYPSADVDEPNAALFSKADLTLAGGGALTVEGNSNDGIASKDGLLITGGTIRVQAADDGVRGKDYLVIEGGNVTVIAQGDGLKADNAEDATRGYIAIEGGVVNVSAGGDAIAAETDVTIADGTLTLASGGGSGNAAGSGSAKGIKGGVGVVIDGGSLTIDAADDALHSNGSVVINGGTLVLASGDDGIHADESLTIRAGSVQIVRAYEGIESARITLDGGDIRITSSDDGINVAGGVDGSGGGAGGGPGGPRGQDAFASTGDAHLAINGGFIVVDAGGDGIDSNGPIQMTDGVVLVHGPTQNMNGALDYEGGFTLTGGTLIAVGSAGMAQAPSGTSSQNSFLIGFDSVQPAGALLHIQNSAGEAILTFAPTKQYQTLAFSSAALVQGETYTVYTGGSATGTARSGWYEDAAYTPGTEYTVLTPADVVTLFGSFGRMGGGGRRP